MTRQTLYIAFLKIVLVYAMLCFTNAVTAQCPNITTITAENGCDAGSPCIFCFDEPQSFNFTVSGTNIPEGTPLSWRVTVDTNDLGSATNISKLSNFSTVDVDNVDRCDVCPTTLGIMVDACNEDGIGEGNNEFMVIHSGSGFLASELGVNFGFQGMGISNDGDINLGNSPCIFRVQPEANLITQLNQSCTDFIPAGRNTTIPANSLVVIFTSSNATREYDLSVLCDSGENIFVLQNECERTPRNGAFSNGRSEETPFTTELYLEECDNACKTAFTYDRGEIGNSETSSTFVLQDQNTGQIEYFTDLDCNVPVGFNLEKPSTFAQSTIQFDLNCIDINAIKDEAEFFVYAHVQGASSCFAESLRSDFLHFKNDANLCKTFEELIQIPNLVCKGIDYNLNTLVENNNEIGFIFNHPFINNNILNVPLSETIDEIVVTVVNGGTKNCNRTPFSINIPLDGDSQNTIPAQIDICEGELIDLYDFVTGNLDFGNWSFLRQPVTGADIVNWAPAVYRLEYTYNNCTDVYVLETDLNIGGNVPIVTPLNKRVCKQDADFELNSLIEEDIDGEWFYEGTVILSDEFRNLNANTYPLVFQPTGLDCYQSITLNTILVNEPDVVLIDTVICRDINSVFRLNELFSNLLFADGTWYFESFLGREELLGGEFDLNRYSLGIHEVIFVPSASNTRLCQDSYRTTVQISEPIANQDTLIESCEPEVQFESEIYVNDTTFILFKNEGGCEYVLNVSIDFSDSIIVEKDSIVALCMGDAITLPDGSLLNMDNPVATIVSASETDCFVSKINYRAHFQNNIVVHLPSDTICYGERVQISGRQYDYNNLPGDTLIISIPGQSCDSLILTDSLIFEGERSISQLRDTLCVLDTLNLYNLDGTFYTQIFNELATNNVYKVGYPDYKNELGCINPLDVEILFQSRFVKDTIISAECNEESLIYRDSIFTVDNPRHTFFFRQNEDGTCDSLENVTVIFKVPNPIITIDTVQCDIDTYIDELTGFVIPKGRGDTIIRQPDLTGCITDVYEYHITFLERDTFAPVQTVCLNEPFEIGGNFYNQNNLPPFVALSCDSVISTANFEQLDLLETNEDYVFCGNDSLHVYDGSGNISRTLTRNQFLFFPTIETVLVTSQNGCDSLITFNLDIETINMPVTQFNTCKLDTFWVYDNWFTPNDTVKNIDFGEKCIQTYEIKVDFIESIDTFPVLEIEANCGINSLDTVIRGETFQFSITRNTDTLKIENADGCVVLVQPIWVHFYENQTTDIGDFYDCSNNGLLLLNPYGSSDTLITDEGNFEIVIPSSTGCDSTIQGNIIKNENIQLIVIGLDEICEGDEIELSISSNSAEPLNLNLLSDNIVVDNFNLLTDTILNKKPLQNTTYSLELLTNSSQCIPLTESTSHQVTLVNTPIELTITDDDCIDNRSATIDIKDVDADAFDIEWMDGDKSNARNELASGIWSFEVTSPNGCKYIDSFEINNYQYAEEQYEILLESCELDSEGNSMIFKHPRLDEERNIVFVNQNSLDSSIIKFDVGTNEHELVNIKNGEYSLYIYDNNQCLLDSTDVSIYGKKLALLPEIEDTTISIPRSIVIDVDTDLSLNWSPANLVNCLSTDCNFVEMLVNQNTEFRYSTRSNEYCFEEKSFEVIISKNALIEFPNAIRAGSTPGFMLHSTDKNYDITKLQIYDRWGTLVYDVENIQTNDFSTAWQGQIENKLVSSGNYVFFAQVILDNGQIQELGGSFTVF